MIPLLCSFGQHTAHNVVQARLQDDESLFAFRDDTSHCHVRGKSDGSFFRFLQGALLAGTGNSLQPWEDQCVERGTGEISGMSHVARDC